MTATTATAPTTATPQTLIGMGEVMVMTGLSRSTVDRYSKSGIAGFPAKVQLTDTGTRQSPVAFVLEEVKAWIEQRKNARTTEVA